jgi:hypothetical protein
LVRGRPSARLARGGRWAAAIVIASGCTSGSGHPAASGITDSPHPLAGQVRASPQLCSTFQPVAVSWTATRSGWLVLGRDCHRGQSFHFAYRLLHTTDAGKRWQPASIPSTRTNDGPEQIAFTADGVGDLFNTEHSWRTTDAAKQWLPMPGMHTEALSVDGAWTYRIGYTHSGCPGPCQAIVQRAATGTAEWQTLLVRRTSFGSTLATAGPRVLVGIKGSPAGGRPDAHTVLITSVDAGSSWRTRTDPCGGHGRSESDGYLSAVTAGGQVAVACSRRYQPVRSLLTFSTDAGVQFAPKHPTPLSMVWVIAYVHRTLLAGDATPQGRLDVRIATTANRGASWTVRLTDHARPLDSYLDSGPELSCAGHGCAYVADPRAVFISTDDAQTWTRVRP